MSYEISMSYYEGPMDLLLDLVSKKKIEISEVSISELADEYLAKLEDMKTLDMELTSDFIYMASRLLEMKSRYMLYLNEEEETKDPRVEFFEALKEYSAYRRAAEFLAQRYLVMPKRYFRLAAEIYTEEKLDLSKLSIKAIAEAFPMKKSEKIQQQRPDFIRQIISVEEKIQQIHELLQKREAFYFEEALRQPYCEEQVATMLGILELARGRRIDIYQNFHLDRIMIKRGELSV